jgi:hypothetical protein
MRFQRNDESTSFNFDWTDQRGFQELHRGKPKQQVRCFWSVKLSLQGLELQCMPAFATHLKLIF